MGEGSFEPEADAESEDVFAGGGGGGGGAFLCFRGASTGAAGAVAVVPASCLRWNLRGTGGSRPTKGPPSWAM